MEFILHYFFHYIKTPEEGVLSNVVFLGLTSGKIFYVLDGITVPVVFFPFRLFDSLFSLRLSLYLFILHPRFYSRTLSFSCNLFVIL